MPNQSNLPHYHRHHLQICHWASTQTAQPMTTHSSRSWQWWCPPRSLYSRGWTGWPSRPRCPPLVRTRRATTSGSSTRLRRWYRWRWCSGRRSAGRGSERPHSVWLGWGRLLGIHRGRAVGLHTWSGCLDCTHLRLRQPCSRRSRQVSAPRQGREVCQCRNGCRLRRRCGVWFKLRIWSFGRIRRR